MAGRRRGQATGCGTLTFDRPITAGMAPFVMAAADGLFASEGLAVTTDVTGSSAEAIERVAAGTSQLALVDVNELIRFRGKPTAPPVKAVFMLFNKSPYAFVARKSRGIRALSDIEGKTLGVAEGDFSFRLWPALARQNGIKPGSVKVNKISAAVREPMLSAGQVDAVAGFSYLSAVNLRDRGVPGRRSGRASVRRLWLRGLRLRYHRQSGLRGRQTRCGQGFVRAVIAGTHLAIREPGRAADQVASRMDGGSRDLELERLNAVISGQHPHRRGQAQRHRRHRSGPPRSGRSIKSPRISSS